MTQVQNQPSTLSERPTPQEVAAYLGICDRTLRRWWESGVFPEPRRFGVRRLRFRRSDVEAWLAEFDKEGTEE